MKTYLTERHVAAREATVEDAANLYLDEIYRRAQAGQVSWSYTHATRYRLKSVCEALGRGTLMAHVGKAELLRASLYFAARPIAKQRPYQVTVHGERAVSAATAQNWITQLRHLFVWASEHDALAWPRPRGFERLFRLKDRRMLTPEEREREAREMVSGEILTVSVNELERLYRAGRPRDRLYMLLGLNCGFTSGEMSSLRTFEVHLEVPHPYLHKRRNKTGVEARWLLWPETVSLLRRFRAPENDGRRLILTRCGNPLVEVTEEGRRDAVDQAWGALHQRVPGSRWLGFRFLRKTGANAVKRLGGLEESEMYLAHQEPGLNKAYANRNWEKMWRCLDLLRTELPFLGPAWAIDPAECLFTQNGWEPWGDIEPPYVPQNVSKRSELGLLNVSYNKQKRKYYARVYRDGRTYCSGYFDTAAEAETAAKRIRLSLDGSRPARLDPRR